jgi:excisionase family DNA binding protein
MNPLAYSVPEVCQLARAGRTAVYQAINSGELIAHKRGARTLIFASDLQRWLESLPKIEMKHPNNVRMFREPRRQNEKDVS